MEVGKRTFKKFMNGAHTEEQINKKVELTTMLFFQIVQLDNTARELKDLSTHEEKRELNDFINRSKRVIKAIERKFKIDVEGSDEEIDDVYYELQDVLYQTTLRQMNAFRRGLEKQFLDTTKFFK